MTVLRLEKLVEFYNTLDAEQVERFEAEANALADVYVRTAIPRVFCNAGVEPRNGRRERARRTRCRRREQ